MRCPWRPLRAGETRNRRWLARAVLLGLAFGPSLGFIAVFPAHAAGVAPPPVVPPAPPVPTPSMIDQTVSSGETVTNLGSNFLERLNNQSTNGFSRMLRTNPGGRRRLGIHGHPRYRTWFEGYGISASNGPVGQFAGDSRKTWGGVAGIGARVVPGFNVGFSVDQSRTAIDVPLALQSATIDLTQLGFTASVDSGPWTWATAAVHGFGNINSHRDTGFGFATAGYNARLDGVLSEISYYWSKDQNRIVPKAALEYVHARTGSLQEFGGLDPVTATAATVDRMRVLVGAEVGHYWILDQKIFDVSAYGKFVDNLVQNFSDITVSLGTQSVTFQGIGESRYGADAGASASLSLTNTIRVYANYDAKFRARDAVAPGHGWAGVEVVAV